MRVFMRTGLTVSVMVCAISVVDFKGLWGGVVPRAEAVEKTDDPLPWPWGTECSFPWDKVEGVWRVKGKRNSDFFDFRVLGVLENGSRLFKMTQWDANGGLLSEGMGLATPEQKILRVLMDPEESRGAVPLRALMRAYSDSSRRTCTEGQLVMVLTLRTIGAGSTDLHLVLRKVPIFPGGINRAR